MAAEQVGTFDNSTPDRYKGMQGNEYAKDAWIARLPKPAQKQLRAGPGLIDSMQESAQRIPPFRPRTVPNPRCQQGEVWTKDRKYYNYNPNAVPPAVYRDQRGCVLTDRWPGLAHMPPARVHLVNRTIDLRPGSLPPTVWTGVPRVKSGPAEPMILTKAKRQVMVEKAHRARTMKRRQDTQAAFSRRIDAREVLEAATFAASTRPRAQSAGPILPRGAMQMRYEHL